MGTSAPPCDIPTESNPEASSNFKEYVDGHPTPGVDGYGISKNYITFNDLEKYWNDDRIDQLFLSFHPPIVLSTNEVIKRYLRTLSILAYIGRAGYIHWFFTHDSDDTRLPHESLPHGLPGGDGLYKDFSSHQWKFWPYEFGTVPYMKPLNANCILPITILETLSPATTDSSRPVIQKVALNRVWNRLVRTDEERTVVFKTYNGVESSLLWENEVKTFQEIAQKGKCDHIVECLGSFKQIQSNKYVIMLEYADGGTLLDLFKENNTPLKHQDRVRLWERLFDLLIGLQRIHGLPSDGSKSLMSLRCIHLDIKPANILVFKGQSPGPHSCQFKLADFGSSPTRKVLSGQPMKAEDTGGTPMYSPPECCRDFRYLSYENLTVTTEADIWSLGCVFSEVLVWTTMREDGRQDYELRRVAASKSRSQRITDAGYGGCFHNIDSPLVEVDAMHKEAEGYSLQDDRITHLVSELILKHMLRVPLDGRLPPSNLLRMFRDEVKKDTVDCSGMAKTANLGSKKPADRSTRQDSKPDDTSPSRDKTNFKSKTWAGQTSSDEGTQRRPSAIPSRLQDLPEANSHAKPQIQNSGQKPSAELPMVSVADVNTWREYGGGKRISRFLRSLPREALMGMEHLHKLRDRDQYFFIDDSASMAKYKPEIIETFQALAYLVKRVDTDGIDLYFMSDPKTCHHNNHSGPLVKLIKDKSMQGISTMELSLDTMADIIIEKNIPRRRPVSLYILTDGDWGLKDRRSLGGMDKTIERLVSELGRKNKASNFIALQFIRFGDLPDGIRRLRKLDNLGMPSRKHPNKRTLEKDIVDHSSYKSSVWKMLIGSLAEGVDNDSDEDNSDCDEKRG